VSRAGGPGIVVTSSEAVTAFYRQPLAWVALLVSTLLLSFGGGAVMFWFHAVLRGEQGPAIGYVDHWLLDSSLGFFALTPVLALICPWACGRREPPAAPGCGRPRRAITLPLCPRSPRSSTSTPSCCRLTSSGCTCSSVTGS